MSKENDFLHFMSDGQWHENAEIVKLFGWAINQRKNEMQRRGGLYFERRQSKIKGKSALWWYRLRTPIEQIDFEHCCLKGLYAPKLKTKSQPVIKARMNVEIRPGRSVVGKNGQMRLAFQ